MFWSTRLYHNSIKWMHSRVTGPLCRKFTGHRWIPLTKASDAELWYFLWSMPNKISGWVNNRDARGLRCHRAHYDGTVMYCEICFTWDFLATSKLLASSSMGCQHWIQNILFLNLLKCNSKYWKLRAVIAYFCSVQCKSIVLDISFSY